MPKPDKFIIPPEAGYPGLPIDDAEPEYNKAKTFYKDVIQPRTEFQPPSDENPKGEWKKMEFGKPGGQLYDIWKTTPMDLKEFGLGVAMYFATLQLLCVTFFCCGLMQAQAMSYYKSEMYSDRQIGVPGMLRGSAICTRTQFVCLDMDCATIDSKNLCHMGQMQAWFDLSMTILLLILVAIMTVAQDNISAALDESLQTAQDYSVIVDDPGPEDDDPQLWADFFGQFGHVTFVTIAKDNGPLIKAMANRRAIMREIIMIIGNGEASMEDDDDGVLDTTWEGKNFKAKITEMATAQAAPKDGKEKTRNLIAATGAFGMKSMGKWVGALSGANDAVQKALAGSKDYKPSKVFITFETEIAQRRCLKALAQGLLSAAFDLGKDKMDPAYVFKGTNVLAVKEAPEPSEVFWEDVQVTFNSRFKQQSITFVMTFGLVVGSVFACKALQTSLGAGGAALWISLTNIIIPIVIKMFVTKVEDHVSVNDQQLSLFLKLTFFRWMNTAIVIYMITDFDAFLTLVAMKQIQAVIFADAITSPIIRTLDPSMLINQLIICHYAPTQEKMNSYFLGNAWMAADRYSDMTKTLFLALFYSALFPAGLFFTCLGYGFIYTVDKYSLLRTWRTPAEIDDDITKISRGHITFAVYCHAVMTMVFYAEFPFDNVCDDPDAQVLPAHIFKAAHLSHNVTTDKLYLACDQTATGSVVSMVFGASPRDTMYGKQQRVVRVYGILCLILTVMLFVVFFGKGIIMGIYYLFHGKYSSDTSANEQHFSSCDIQAYIPIVTHAALAFPLVACDVSTYDTKYLPFELPEKDLFLVQSLYNKHELPGFSKADLDAIFSCVRHFPPPDDLVEEMTAEEKAAKDKKHKKGGGDAAYEAVPDS
jgi:hypothetical protein